MRGFPLSCCGMVGWIGGRLGRSMAPKYIRTLEMSSHHWMDEWMDGREDG